MREDMNTQAPNARLTPERRREIAQSFPSSCGYRRPTAAETAVGELLAEINALTSERDGLSTAMNTMAGAMGCTADDSPADIALNLIGLMGALRLYDEEVPALRAKFARQSLLIAQGPDAPGVGAMGEER